MSDLHALPFLPPLDNWHMETVACGMSYRCRAAILALNGGCVLSVQLSTAAPHSYCQPCPKAIDGLSWGDSRQFVPLQSEPVLVDGRGAWGKVACPGGRHVRLAERDSQPKLTR